MNYYHNSQSQHRTGNMPPKKGATGAPARKTTSTIAQAFRPASKKTGATAAAGKTAVLARSDSTQKLGKAVSAGASTSRSASPEKSKQDEHGLTKERLQEAQSLPELDVQDPQWDDIWATVRRDKLGKVGASEYHVDGVDGAPFSLDRFH